MLLAIDIGNTNIVAALFNGDTLFRVWRIFSDARRTGDEYSSILFSLFRDANVSMASVDSAAVSSVVPELIGPFVGLIERAIGKKPLLVGASIYPLLPIQIPDTVVHEVGTDIVCNALEAFCRFHAACIIVDFGTALTFIAVGQTGALLGAAIAPGLKTAVNSLFSNAAQLPSVPLEAPPSSLGMNTIQSIQSGIVLGYKGLVESLIGQMKDDMANAEGISREDIHVIATGGLNSVLNPITSVFRHVDKELILYGLKRISEITGENHDN